jgi:hypothetical protein
MTAAMMVDDVYSRWGAFLVEQAATYRSVRVGVGGEIPATVALPALGQPGPTQQ